MTGQNIPEGSIVITPTEVYNEVKALTDVVRQMVANDAAEIDSRRDLKSRVETLKIETDARLDKFDTRLTAVERKMLMFTGAAAAAGAGIGTWLPRVLGGA
jgi:hypothetical protein